MRLSDLLNTSANQNLNKPKLSIGMIDLMSKMELSDKNGGK